MIPQDGVMTRLPALEPDGAFVGDALSVVPPCWTGNGNQVLLGSAVAAASTPSDIVHKRGSAAMITYIISIPWCCNNHVDNHDKDHGKHRSIVINVPREGSYLEFLTILAKSLQLPLSVVISSCVIQHGSKVISTSISYQKHFQLQSAATRTNDEKKDNTINNRSCNHCCYYYLSMRLRLLGGTDRQNRVGSKFGGGGMSSSQNAERDRKERLRELAMESIDLAKDPYLMRNHLGTYECKLCLTLHTNEANYLAHTQGKKHQAGLARRAAIEKKLAPTLPAADSFLSNKRGNQQGRFGGTRVKIGRPGYEIMKSRDPKTNQRCLTFTLDYPEVASSSSTGNNSDDNNNSVMIQPRHRFMSAYEQRVEVPDKKYQYLLIACEPYETVAFKISNEPIDRGEGRFITNWDIDTKRFTLTFYFMEPNRHEM